MTMVKPVKADQQKLQDARAALATRVEFQAFLDRLSPKDRTNVERHLAGCEAAEPSGRHAALWRRLTAALMTLAPHSAKTNAGKSVQFYTADGKYRMQRFAIEDLLDGKLTVYCADVLAQATRSGLLAAAGPESDDDDDDERDAGPAAYAVRGSRDPLLIEQLDGQTANPAPFFKDMTGWNRRALRVILPAHADEPLVEAVEILCALSVQPSSPNPKK